MRLKLSIILLCSMLISSCGWHLRGVANLPEAYRVLSLQSAASNSFNQQLQLQLKFNGVLLTQHAEDAQAVLRVSELVIDKRTLALTTNGKVAEYELNATLHVELQRIDEDKETIIELTSRRHLRNDINNVTGTENAEKHLIREMEKDLVNKLMHRLQRISHEN